MNKKDIFSNCRQLQSDIERVQAHIRETETQLGHANNEIQQLENAKIATRLEFGSATDIETVRTRENSLNEINQTLDSRLIERERLNQSLQTARAELANFESTFNSLGCRNII